MNTIKNLFANITIRTKLMLLAGGLLLALAITNIDSIGVITNMHGTMGEMRGDIQEMRNQVLSFQDVLTDQQNVMNRLTVSRGAINAFNDTKYWMTDLALSLLAESERNAVAAKKTLEKSLDQVATYAPDEAKRVRELSDTFFKLGMESVDAYTDENRIKGNSLLSEARSAVGEATQILLDLEGRQAEQANEAKNAALDATVDTAETAIGKARRALTSADASIKELKIIVGILIAISLAFTFIIMMSIIRPINNVVVAMNKLASGNISIEIPPVTKNEIGKLIEALTIFKKNAHEKVQLEEEQKKAEEHAKVEKKQAMNNLANKFEERVQRMIKSVASAAAELRQTAEFMKSNIGDVDAKAKDAASYAKKTSANVNTVASAAEEMASSVREITGQVVKSTGAVNEAVGKAEVASSSARTLEESTLKIGSVVEFIRDIANQINLLALNATIESARAGEAGRGFAVVASEVKNLANQTSQATEDISKQIEGVQSVSADVVKALDAIRKSVDNVSQYSSGISSAVEEQSATTGEIAQNMQVVSQGTQEISNNLSVITSSSAQASTSSLQMLSASEILSKEAEQLNTEVASFLSEVRNG